MKKLIAIGLVALMTLGLLSGALAEATGNAFNLGGDPVTPDKTFTTFINFPSETAFNGNIYDASAGPPWGMEPYLFDYLCMYTLFPETEFRASMLEEYAIDGNVLTMKLRTDLFWSDGNPITVDDVLTSLYMDIGKNALYWSYVEKMERIDDLTIQVTFVSDSPIVPTMILRSPIKYSQEEYGKWADQFIEIAMTGRVIDELTGRYKYTEEADAKKTAVNEDCLLYQPDVLSVTSSGPYVITAYTNAEVLFVPNEYFRIPMTNLTNIRGLKAGADGGFAADILAGNFDLENGGLSPDMGKTVDEKYAATMRKVYVPELSQMGVGFNIAKYPLDIPEVRKAICFATDRELLVELGEPGSFPNDSRNIGIPPSIVEKYITDVSDLDLVDYSYDPEKAEELLTSIGWSRNGQGKWVNEKGEIVPIELATISSWPSLMMPSEAMATLLNEFGFTIEFTPMEGSTVWTHLSSGDQAIGAQLISGGSAYGHPYEAYNAIFNTYFARFGLPLVPQGEHRIITDPVTGEDFNVTVKLAALFDAKTNEEIEALTKEFMVLLNNLCLWMPTIEKYYVLRVYNPNLNMHEAEYGAVMHNYFYNGNLNNVLVKMLHEGTLYWSENTYVPAQ